MELVYLWVEEYKNIKKQGFNFSPRFDCKYDEDKNELSIDENKEYLNIFPENINITAIVGENGSGKSSILDCIIDSIAYNNTKHLILFESNKKFYCSKICKCDFKLEFLEHTTIIGKNNEFLEICTHSSDLLNSELIFNRNLDIYQDINPMSIKDTLFDRSLNEMQALLTLNLDKVTNQIQKLSLKETLNNSSTFFSPQEYQISFNKNRLNYILRDIKLYGEGKDKKIKEQVNSYINKILSNKKVEYIIEFYFFINKFQREDNQYNYLKQAVENEEFIEPILPILSKEETNIKNYFLSFIKEVNIWNNYNDEVQKKFKEMIKKDKMFSVFLDLFDINLKEKEKYFSDLSFGEKHLFLLEGLIQDTKNKNVLFLLDEIDLAYHPNWSKNLINKLIKATNKSIHIVISSHSPFILTDLAKKNVIFLDKVDKDTKEKYPLLDISKLENGNCINVSKYMDINPFGANIHTLLSHGFFMKDGLMGEFAKGKISKMLKFLNGENKFIDLEKKILPPLKIQPDFFEKNLKPIIEFIGEDFLKEKLLTMYEIKFPKSKEEKIKELEAEIKRLKK